MKKLLSTVLGIDENLVVSGSFSIIYDLYAEDSEFDRKHVIGDILEDILLFLDNKQF